MYYNRILEQTIIKTSKTFPVVLVTGPRQVGKTTLLTKMAEESRTIVSLDNPTVRGLAKEDPELFMRQSCSLISKCMWINIRIAEIFG